MSKKVSILVGSLRKGSFARKNRTKRHSHVPRRLRSANRRNRPFAFIQLRLRRSCRYRLPTPSSYTEFRETIKASAGVLFVTSENNRTVPACLKNAIDIGSKPNADVAWKKTPAGIISHSVGKMGGYSAQKNLRLALSYFDMPLTGQPEVFSATRLPFLTTTASSSNPRAALFKAISTNWLP